MTRVDFYFLAILACVLGIIGCAVLMQNNTNHALNAWAARCNRDGGVVQTTRYTLTGNHLECIKNGKIIDHQN